MNKKLISIAAVAATITLGITACSTPGVESSTGGNASSATDDDSATGTLSMNGSTSMEKVIKAVNGAFEAKTGNKVSLNLTGSGTGIKEAIEGKCDIGNSSRELKEDEAAELDATVIGIDGIALVVHPNNKVEDLTMEDLAKIYAGEITNWKDVGGDDKAIVVVGREDGSGTRDGFESVVMGDKTAQYAQELESTGSVINAVGTTEGAIGYASLANVDDTVKALKIDGAEATEENIKAGTYKVQRPFICAVKKGSENQLVKDYIDFILSAEGQELVRAQGAIPVK